MRRNVPIVEGEEAELVATLAGRTIVSATWIDSSPDADWDGHEYLLLELDDGRKIRCGGYGFDAYGATIGLADKYDEPRT